MQRVRHLVPALVFVSACALAPVGTCALQDPVESEVPAPAPFAALTKATAKAKLHNKRVLVVLTPADADTLAALKKDMVVSRPLLYEFETAQFSGSEANALAKKLQLEGEPDQRPALAVLDTDGKVLARLSTADVLVDGKVAGKPLLAKLKPHFCEPVDAEKKLAAALVEAEQSGRAIFVRFDAPW